MSPHAPSGADLYGLLELTPEASEADIKRAFRRLALVHHPDHRGGSADSHTRFGLILNAYRTLSNPELRRTYDHYLASRKPPPARPRSAPRSGSEVFVVQLNALLWDLEDRLNARDPETVRRVVTVLADLDRSLLHPTGLGDHFMEARQLPPLDPRDIAAVLCGDRVRPGHFPYSDAAAYFYDVRRRMNRFLGQLPVRDLQAPIEPGLRWVDGLIAVQNRAFRVLAGLY